MTTTRFYYDITLTDKIITGESSAIFINNILACLFQIRKMILTCYRAGGAVAELAIFYGNKKCFCLTIREGTLNMTQLSAEDIRLEHKEISLPDIADILILVTRLARHAGLSASLSTDAATASVLEFTS